MTRRTGRNGGFSLMEVLITALIIIVLAALALPTFTQARKKSAEKTCALNRSAMQSEVDAALLRSRGEKKADILADLQSDLNDYTCPSGGKYSVKEEADGSWKVSCSVHGETDAAASSGGN